MSALRTEADAAVDRAEAAEAKIKKLEQELLGKEQDVTSLTHKLDVLEGQLADAEGKLGVAKSAQQEGELSKATSDELRRKIQLLEDELDAAEKNAKETVEKYVPHRHPDRPILSVMHLRFQAETSGREGGALRAAGHPS